MAKIKENQRWATNRQVAAYVGVHVMTLWRWRQNPKMNFPQPTVINNRPRTDLDLVDGWMGARVAPGIDNTNIKRAREIKDAKRSHRLEATAT